MHAHVLIALLFLSILLLLLNLALSGAAMLTRFQTASSFASFSFPLAFVIVLYITTHYATIVKSTVANRGLNFF